uniref:Mitochondrial distribution and morphology protein 12 n=1 Tax=Colletotrichum fructicola (strain Nara gc5) TaxID=1213859 RepID=L2G9G3_COLFN
MSIDLNWETLTTGPDGEALALRIRDFIHTKFQAVPLPRFIKSVKVHDFEFGAIAPELELKDITDPLPDFYEENPDIEDDEEEDEDVPEPTPPTPQQVPSELRAAERREADGGYLGAAETENASAPRPVWRLSEPVLGGVNAGDSGRDVEFALFSVPSRDGVVRHADASRGGSWRAYGDFNPAAFAQQQQLQDLREKASVSTEFAPHARRAEEDDEEQDENAPRFREPRPEDLQAVFRIRFVGIPVQLSVTGLTFDGIGVMAHIRKRVHFCFLNPEDAATAVGVDEAGPTEPGKRFGGLLQEIQVESEIGLRDGGKQSLKNVGKVERFVLEQVRRIFENEFVYPSFWTFLV